MTDYYKYTIGERFVVTTPDSEQELRSKIDAFFKSLGTNVIHKREILASWINPTTSQKRKFNPDGTPLDPELS